MKINEAVDKINELETVYAKHVNDCLFVFGVEGSQFAYIEDGQKEISAAGFDTGMCNDVSLSDMAKVAQIIQELVDTPVEQRKPEKEYYLYFASVGKYVCQIFSHDAIYNGTVLGFHFGPKAVFSESRLAYLKRIYPELKSAIDEMKVPVEE